MRTVISLLLMAAVTASASAADAASPAQVRPELEQGFGNPPRDTRIRAYWWWLNGHVTAASITRDLEQMAAKGFGGALICDAGGAEQDGNDRVPHGPDFFGAQWRELYKHTLREADRLGLEMSLNIQSGWNLGGPMVSAEDAPKKLVWSEVRISGPASIERKLPAPQRAPAFYRDVAVVAYPVKAATAGTPSVRVTASSSQPDHPAGDAMGDAGTFWVSGGLKPGEGPTRQRPQWLQFTFDSRVAVTGLKLKGRPGYGPREGELQISDDGKTWRAAKAFEARDGQELAVSFSAVRATSFRLVFHSAFDSRFPDSPRNVQVAEVALHGENGQTLTPAQARRPILNWDKKALHRALSFSAPDTSPLLEELAAREGEEDAHANQVLDLTAGLDEQGTLRWEAPAGEWQVLRFGCTLNDHCRVSTCSDGWQGYALDPFDDGAFSAYWKQVVEPLIADAGPLAGRVLKYLHTDSWEVEVANWTPTLREQFHKRRGYDLLPFLPIIAGRIVDSRPVSNRFLHDFRKTMGDLAVDNHYRLYSEWAQRHNLLIHPESGGPHAVPVDSLRCLGMNDAPMSEFWAWSWRHRVGDANRFFVKQPASAAHASGRRLVAAEGFTTIGPHWQETLWDNLKPAFDQAACEGMNMLFWHAFTCSPAEMGLPGQEYFAGTHFNPNATWWDRSEPFLAYLNRCQYLLRQGLFVADACYYYGDHVPNFAQLKRSDPCGVLPGHDYDVVTEHVILTRMSVRDGRIVLPDGMSYRLLVLPDRRAISLPVLRKLKELVAAGATVIGPRPQQATGLSDYPNCDRDVGSLAAQLWGDAGGGIAEHRFGAGRIVWGKTARQVLRDDGIKPDFEAAPVEAQASLDYIHRRDGQVDIYFVANRAARPADAQCTFRIDGKLPELWDPLTGETRPAAAWSQADGRTTLPLEFSPCGSLFVVFRKPATAPTLQTGARNFPRLTLRHTFTGPWTVRFDPKWGGPASAEFSELISWTRRPEEGIRFYSGTAVYWRTFDLPQSLRTSREPLMLDLGDVKNLAEVRLNGRNLGVLWTPPFRVDATAAMKPTDNRLEIDIVNFWPNRVIGDAGLPPEKRFTRTNIRKLTRETPLIDSGLLGPVTLQAVTERPGNPPQAE